MVRPPLGGNAGSAALKDREAKWWRTVYERWPQTCSIVKVGGAEEESGALGSTLSSRPRFPGPAFQPTSAPGSASTSAPPPAAAPSSRSWCCGAAEPRGALSMAGDPSAKVREAGNAGGGGAWAGRLRPGQAFHTSSPPSPPRLIGQAFLTAESPGPA